MGDQQIDALVGYLAGDRDRLRLRVDLGPIMANTSRLGQIYFSNAIASLQERPEPDYARFTQRMSTLVKQLAAGQRPEGGLPSPALSHRQAVAVAEVLLRLVPAAQRPGLRSMVTAALDTGDMASALAAVAPLAVTDRMTASGTTLTRSADGQTWVLTTDLAPTDDMRRQAHQVRAATRLFQQAVEPTAAVLAVAALMLLWSAAPQPTAHRLIPLGWTLTAAATTTGLLTVWVKATVGSTPYRPPSSWPPTAARLVGDIQTTAMHHVLTTATVAALILSAAGALLIGSGWALVTRPTVRIPFTPRHGLALAAVVSASALVGTTVAPAAMNDSPARICQGSPRWCGLRYDELAQLAAHNAMSTTADRFISPEQDPDIVGQLNAGVRVLLLDTHHWERPGQIAARIATSAFSPALRRQLTRTLQRVDPYRPGLWLCHSVCGAGALELTATLRQIGDWLDAHPTEIVTLILQDGISSRETRRAFENAGLTDLLYEPDPDPGRPWPLLKDMIDSGRRLVVFAQRADGPAPWYRNFYRYGMETPFAVRSPAEMTCAPQRGGTGKRLFLLNHFITDGGARRLYAGTVNSRQAVLQRAHACERIRGRPVNFVAVDYATVGDARSAVAALNAERVRAEPRRR
ncbi:PI-PLC domain-containing protein [Streptomyces sp. NPDC057403]|uniref:PI-PLC domain-containing protein n=1 Tax=Streptomyces sp. NPDC057403 TaxID=3346119 RepID=UPI00368A25BA